jgi:tetratricopeptide (TPR) repeat protein
MVASGALLALLLSPFNASWAFDQPWFLQSVSSPRKLNGDELLRIAEIHDVQNHFPEALTYYEQALASFRASKQRRGEAVTLVKIGSIFERQGRREAAAARLREAVSLFSKFPDHPAHAEALLALGRVSAWLWSREEAGRLFEQAIHRFGQSHNLQGVGQAKIQLGLLRISDGRSEEGLRLLVNVMREAQSRHDENLTLAALLALGDAQWILDQPDGARDSYRDALVLAEKGLQTRLEADLQRRLSHVYEALGQSENGIAPAKRALTLYQSLRDPSSEAASWALLASLYRATGQDNQGEEATERALSIHRHQQFMVHAVR